MEATTMRWVALERYVESPHKGKPLVHFLPLYNGLQVYECIHNHDF